VPPKAPSRFQCSRHTEEKEKPETYPIQFRSPVSWAKTDLNGAVAMLFTSSKPAILVCRLVKEQMSDFDEHPFFSERLPPFATSLGNVFDTRMGASVGATK
jgi:hypothetical protein